MSLLKLLSWNVNGLRSSIKKGLVDVVKKESPTIFCVQETRANPDQADLDTTDPEFSRFPYKIWNSAEKKGFAGTLVLSEVEPEDVRYGMNIPEHDKEGRLTICIFPKFTLFNIYAPNSNPGLKKLPERVRWDHDFIKFINNFKKEVKKPLFLVGDWNVAHKEKDCARPNPGSHGFTTEEREGIDMILKAGFVDTYRKLNGDKVEYTFWSNFASARERNVGWRVDYLFAESDHADAVTRSSILGEYQGSDHCPISADINLDKL
eukprot:TRINITY_DN894_c0_g1_i1.p1 TRINITY_DN894_c0_g1~~TRINITY_DN894_c0_g1_i1.p1  ORF type:complete len:263 (-),score=43.64 TRINITY_DN894_c0_g1_i1:79-867(-)